MTTAQRATAARMIEAKGQTVVLTRSTPGSYSPSTGSASITTTTQTGKGVILPLAAGLKHMAGSNIPHGACQCLLSGLAADGTVLDAPLVDDLLAAGSKDYTIAEVSALEPDGTAIIYDLTIVGAR